MFHRNSFSFGERGSTFGIFQKKLRENAWWKLVTSNSNRAQLEDVAQNADLYI